MKSNSFRFILFVMLFSAGFMESAFCRSKVLEMRGADVSYLDRLSSAGTEFRKNGKTEDFLAIMQEAGVNWIRLRLWNNPADGWCGPERTAAAALRAKQAGFKVLLDFHYSDTWADPMHQNKPADWEKLPFDELAVKVGAYTEEILVMFDRAGCMPDMVQLGNEITGGLLWPDGKVGRNGSCEKTMKLLKSASAAVRRVNPDLLIMMHLENGQDKDKCMWWFGEAEKASLDYDVIGLSYYPFWADGKGLSVIKNNIETLYRKFGKKVCIAETAYPWTFDYCDNRVNVVGRSVAESLLASFPASVKGQRRYLDAICKTVSGTQGGCGVFWWEPDAVSVPYADPVIESDMENLAWFDFNLDYNGTGDAFLKYR